MGQPSLAEEWEGLAAGCPAPVPQTVPGVGPLSPADTLRAAWGLCPPTVAAGVTYKSAPTTSPCCSLRTELGVAEKKPATPRCLSRWLEMAVMRGWGRSAPRAPMRGDATAALDVWGHKPGCMHWLTAFLARVQIDRVKEELMSWLLLSLGHQWWGTDGLPLCSLEAESRRLRHPEIWAPRPTSLPALPECLLRLWPQTFSSERD